METLLNTMSNPVIWGVVLTICGVILKAKLTTYLRLISILIDAIEIIDDDIKDIVSNEQRQRLVKIKAYIASRVGKDRGVLDKMLDNQGYLAKGTQIGGAK